MNGDSISFRFEIKCQFWRQALSSFTHKGYLISAIHSVRLELCCKHLRNISRYQLIRQNRIKSERCPPSGEGSAEVCRTFCGDSDSHSSEHAGAGEHAGPVPREPHQADEGQQPPLHRLHRGQHRGGQVHHAQVLRAVHRRGAHTGAGGPVVRRQRPQPARQVV